jgi:hypothetical protein
MGNGLLFTDFDARLLTHPASEITQRNRKIIHMGGRSFGARIGNGGHQLTFNTLNGNVYIRKRQG